MSTGIIQNQLFLCQNIDEIKKYRTDIVDTVRTQGYALIRNVFDRVLIREKLKTVMHYANTATHRATTGVTSAEIRANMSKWSIGGNSNSQADIARFMLTIYNPLFESDLFDLHSEFKKLIEVRDVLADRAILNDSILLPIHFNACRIQLYPAGGGFMGKHIDSRGVSTLREITNQDSYIQLVLLLTQKGIDFHSGGAFVIQDDTVIDSELNSVSGDILVYDGLTNHGVADIDSSSPLDIHNLQGRAVALATIYNKK